MGERAGRRSAVALSWLAALTLAACGGGGGGGGGAGAAPGGSGAAPGGPTGPGAPPDPGGPGEPSPPPDPGPRQPRPPLTVGAWTFYGEEQGLSPEVFDVSADEAGNVYVAGGDALYAKAAAAPTFLRFDGENAGLTRNCWAPAEIANPAPPGPASLCPVISVGGAGAGRAVIGLKGVGTDSDRDAPWALDSGGADVVAFDAAAGTAARERHVHVASPPGVVCEEWLDPPRNSRCAPFDYTWLNGREKMRQIQRIVVNHDRTRRLSHGDVMMAGTHGAIAILVAHPQERRWIDYTKGDPAWADTRFVWEHEHPALTTDDQFLTGESWALAIDPRTNVPWFANQFRIARLPDYATQRAPSANAWWGPMDPPAPFLSIWRPEASTANPDLRDNVESMSFCDDGTLWVGSSTHGLARIAPDGTIARIPLPAELGPGAWAVACDPSDRSVWIGLFWGGLARLKDGAFTAFSQGREDFPAFARFQPVRSIQIDRWSNPRVVYFAHVASPGPGGTSRPGGVTAYAGE